MGGRHWSGMGGNGKRRGGIGGSKSGRELDLIAPGWWRERKRKLAGADWTGRRPESAACAQAESCSTLSCCTFPRTLYTQKHPKKMRGICKHTRNV